MISVHFQGKPFKITVIQVYDTTTNVEEAEVERLYDDLQDLLELIPKKDVLFIIGNWNAKVGNQEIAGVTGKFGLGVQNEAEQKLIVLPRECTGHSKHSLPTTQEKTLHCQMVNTEIRLTILFAAKEYNQSDFGLNHLVMSMCRVVSWVVGRGCSDKGSLLAKLC